MSLDQQHLEHSHVYPLAAIVGQRQMLEALLILAVDPSLGGLLLMGEKGTAKSTAARGLAEILPPTQAVQGCIYNCSAPLPDHSKKPWHLCRECAQKQADNKTFITIKKLPPFKTIPLGVTEDRLLGGLDWGKTIGRGQPVLKPGLLGEANGGLIYIDEVNLLETSLAHLLLDAASAAEVILEREGLSAFYPAKVTLLATMNPEEGHLGPQLADRFALTVNLAGESDPALRAEVVRRRLAFEADPAIFRQKYAVQTAALTRTIKEARAILAEVKLSWAAQKLISHLAASERLAGHRGDLALAKAARAKAALMNTTSVSPQQVLDISGLVLPTRRRPAPPRETMHIKMEWVEKAESRQKLFEAVYVPDAPEAPPEYKEADKDASEEMILHIFKASEEFQTATPQAKKETGVKGRSGRRASRETAKAIGRSYRTTARRLGRPLSLSATLRAAAPHQLTRKANGGMHKPVILKRDDFREKVYRQKTGRLVVFVVDSSGSIGTLYRMEEAKSAALALLSEAYQKRDRVALIAFYGQKAQMLLPPTNSPDLAARLLSQLPSGGKTPLASAFLMTKKLLTVEQAKDPHLTPYVVLMTDGRPNIPLAQGANPWSEALTMADFMAQDPRIHFLLIDTDRGAYNETKLTRDLAQKLKAPRINLEELRDGKLDAWLGSKF